MGYYLFWFNFSTRFNSLSKWLSDIYHIFKTYIDLDNDNRSRLAALLQHVCPSGRVVSPLLKSTILWKFRNIFLIMSKEKFKEQSLRIVKFTNPYGHPCSFKLKEMIFCFFYSFQARQLLFIQQKISYPAFTWGGRGERK